MTIKRRPLCPRPCGGYVVEIIGGRIAVRCAVCGPAGRFTMSGARRLAYELAGPLGRFQTTAPKDERMRLADLLLKNAVVLEARKLAARRRRAQRRG